MSYINTFLSIITCKCFYNPVRLYQEIDLFLEVGTLHLQEVYISNAFHKKWNSVTSVK